VPLVEEGWIEHPVTEEVARIYLSEAFSEGFEDADVLLLGCTHYPLLKPLFQKTAPAHVKIVDSAESTAHMVAAAFEDYKPEPMTESLAERRGLPRFKFFATDSVEKFKKLGPRFLGHDISDVQHVDLKE
jgi:glutamate racemase